MLISVLIRKTYHVKYQYYIMKEESSIQLLLYFCRTNFPWLTGSPTCLTVKTDISSLYRHPDSIMSFTLGDSFARQTFNKKPLRLLYLTMELEVESGFPFDVDHRKYLLQWISKKSWKRKSKYSSNFHISHRRKRYGLI